uniref:RTP1_C1 domain-containing protein n=1 Tax=Macrostomum lignano TaxID=282301 RepID=A0A1I8J3H7_9PLAT
MRELLCLHRRAGLPDSAAKWLVRAASHLLSEQLLQRPDGVLGLLGAVFDDAAAAGAGDSRHSVSEKVTSVTGLLSACPAKFSDSLAKQLFQVYRRLGPADKRLQSACCHVIVCWCGGANSLAAATLDQLLRDCVLADFNCLAARRPATAAASADASELAVSNDNVTTSSKSFDSKDDVITSSKPDDSKNDVITSSKSVDSKDDVISPKRHAASNNDVIDSAEPIDPEDDVIRSNKPAASNKDASCPAGSAPEDAVNLTEPLSRLSILLSCVKQTDSDFLRRLAGLIDPLFYLLVAATAELQQRKQQQRGGDLAQLCDRLTASLSVFTAVYPLELGTGLLHRLLSEPVNGGHLPSVEFSLPDSILVRPRHVQLPDVSDPALRLIAADVVLALLDSTSDSSGRPGLSGRLFGRLLKDLSDSFSTNGGCMGLGQLSALVRLCQEPRLAERVFSTAQPADLASLCQSLLRHTMLPSAASSAELDEQRRESLELALSIVSAVTLGLHSAGGNAEVAALTPTLLEAAGRPDLPEATRQLARSLAVRTATLGRVSVGDDIDEACRTRPTAVSDLLLSGSALLNPGDEEKTEKEVEDEERAPAAYRAVFADIQSGEPPRMGAGILALTRQLRAGAPRGPRLADACARLLQMCADHPDSYVHLPAAEALAVLACQLPDRLLPLLAGLFGPGDGPGGAEGRRRSTELRLRIGESMVRCSRYLNELLPSQTSRIVGPLLLGARDPEPQLRASAVSCLAELCGRQRWWCLDRPSVGLQEILGCACSLLRSDPDPLPRRAAAHLLCQLVRACDRLSLAGLPAACLSELHRALRLAESVERDEAALVQVRLALEELDACVRDALFPAPSADRMQKRIWVLDAPAPRSIRPGESLQLRLSIGGAGGSRSCHSLLVGSATGASRWHFYVRLIGQLRHQSSVLILRTRQLGGSQVAMVTHKNQGLYRAFAMQYWSIYASLSSPSLAGSSDEVLLDIELVTKCPRNWFYSNGSCYGAASVENSFASFDEAVTGCRHVGANLAMDFGSVSELRSGLSASGWPPDQPVWIGAAASKYSVYFLSAKELGLPLVVEESRDFSHGISMNCSRWSCRCVFVAKGEYFLADCDKKLPYLCSGCADCLVRPVYDLDGLDDLLDGSLVSDDEKVCSGFSCGLLIFGCLFGAVLFGLFFARDNDCPTSRPASRLRTCLSRLRSRLRRCLRFTRSRAASGVRDGGTPDLEDVANSQTESVATATVATDPGNIDVAVDDSADGGPPSYDVAAAVSEILNSIDSDSVVMETNAAESGTGAELYAPPDDDEGPPSYAEAAAAATPSPSALTAASADSVEDSPNQPEPPPSYAAALAAFGDDGGASEA